MPTFNTTNPKPGYIYDASDDTWYPLAGINPNQNLNDLGDVVISSASSGQIVVYDGTNWINSSPTAGDLTAVSAGTGISVTNGAGPIPSVAVDTALVATTSNTMTLSNKTIALGSNTISGTTSQFNSALTDGDFVTQAGTETLTNKTLTTPILTLSSTSSTTSGRIAFNATDDKIIVGDGTNAVEFAASTLAFNPQTGTTYTFALSDKDKMVTANNASAQSYTIPPNSSVAFPVGTQINIIQIGAGQVTINIGSGVTIVSTGATANAPKLRAQYSSATLIKRDTDTWYVLGDIS